MYLSKRASIPAGKAWLIRVAAVLTALVVCGGVAFLLLGIPLPEPVLKPVRQVAAATTPVALIILGASFKMGSSREALHQLIACVSARLLIVPALMLSLAVALGFRGVDLVTLVAIFATPCAVASFAMAQQIWPATA